MSSLEGYTCPLCGSKEILDKGHGEFQCLGVCLSSDMTDGSFQVFENEINREPVKPIVKKVGKKMLWEILVPTEKIWEDGLIKPIRTRYHKVWDEKVRAISGGLTILSPARGQWISPDNELYKEKMIPVRLICTEEEIQEIVDFTLEYYNQQAVLAYKISDFVILKNRKK